MLITSTQAKEMLCPMSKHANLPPQRCVANECAAWRWHTVFRKPKYATLSHKSPRVQEQIGAPPPGHATNDLQGDAFLRAWDSYKKAFDGLTLTEKDFQIPEGWIAEGFPERSDIALEWVLPLSSPGPSPDLGYCGMAGHPQDTIEC